ncbi:MAG TPA: AsmA family protein, partial [Alphaproteobacteria bacterium]|nr:AsmA family protein [Alphaproteobacteria bacterium]
MRKKLVIAALIVVALVAAAGLILPHVIDINKYHDQIQSQLQAKLGRPVSLGKMSMSVFPPSFAVTNASVGDDPSFRAGQVFASTRKLSVSVKFWPLLRKEVVINSLELDRPQIELVRNARGVWNFASLGESKPSPSGKAPASEDIGLSNLVISDGQVAITDQLNRQPRAVYDHIDLEVSDFAPNQEFSLKLAAHLPGQGKQIISLEGKGGPVQASDPMKTNFDGELHLEQVSISGVEKFAGTSALTGIEAQVSGDAKVKNAGGKVTSSGSIRMEDPLIHDVKVGYPITLDYDVSDDLSNDLLQVRKGVVKLGSTPLSLAGTINSKNTPAVVDLKITASDASIGEAARLASAFGVAFGKGMDVNGKVNADIQARGPISNPALNGKISARELAVSGKELPQSVKVDSLELALTPDTIHSNDFSFKAGSTSVAM